MRPVSRRIRAGRIRRIDPQTNAVVEADRAKILAERNIPAALRVSPTISLVAGSGRFADDGDGESASEAGLLVPSSTVTDTAGNVLIVDKEAGRIRKVDGQGIISTLAGNGKRQSGRDLVPATFSGLDEPIHVAVDRQGNTYVGEISGYRVRRIDAETGRIDTVFGARYDNSIDPNEVRENEVLSTWPDFGHKDCRYPSGEDPRGLRFYKIQHFVMLPNDDLIVQTNSKWPVFVKDLDGNLLSERLTQQDNNDVFIEVSRFCYLHQNADDTWSHFVVGNPQLHDAEFISTNGLESAQHQFYLDPVQDFAGVQPDTQDQFQGCTTRKTYNRSTYSQDESAEGDLYFHKDSLQLNVDADGSLLFSSCKYGSIWRVHFDFTLPNAGDIARSAIPELLYDSGLDESIPNTQIERDEKRSLLPDKCFSADNFFVGNQQETTDLDIKAPLGVVGHPSGGVIVREFSGLFKWVLGPGGTPFVVDGVDVFPYFAKANSKENSGLLLKIAHSVPGGVGLNAAGGLADYNGAFAAFALYDAELVVQFSSTGRAEVFGANPQQALPLTTIAGAQYDVENSVSLDELKTNSPTSVTWDGAGNKYVADSDGLVCFFAGGDVAKDKGEKVAGLEIFRAYSVLGEKGRAPVFQETLGLHQISLDEPGGLWFVPGSCLVNGVEDDTQCVIFDETQVTPCSDGNGADGCVDCKSSGRCVFEDGDSTPSPVVGDHLLIADTGNHRILDVDLYEKVLENDSWTGNYTSTAKTLIGTGSPGTTDLSAGTVPARLTNLNRPVSIIQLPASVLGFDVDDMQVMLMVDRGNHVIHIFAEGFLFSELTLLKQFGVPGVLGDTDVVPAPICINDDGDNVCKLDPQQPPAGGCNQCLPSLINARFRYPIGITPSSLDFSNSGGEVTLYVSDAVDRVRALTLDVSNPLSVTGTLTTIADGSLRPSDGLMERIDYHDGTLISLPGAFLSRPHAMVRLPSSSMMSQEEERQEWLIADGSGGRLRRLTRSFDLSNGRAQHRLQTVLGFPRGQQLNSELVCTEEIRDGCVRTVDLNRLQDVRGLTVVQETNGATRIFVSDAKASVLYLVDVPAAFSPNDYDSCEAGESFVGGECVSWKASVALRGSSSDASLPTIAFEGFSAPTSLEYSGSRDELYVADRGAHVIWKIQNASSTMTNGISPADVSVLVGEIGQAGFEIVDGEAVQSTEDVRLFQPEVCF
ncbi:MAG: hypothetical protein GY822_06305 [Deltaproteobacteria bacterium]|nr:hypothetical protein [Deltaproteobacteria bacterium]